MFIAVQQEGLILIMNFMLIVRKLEVVSFILLVAILFRNFKKKLFQSFIHLPIMIEVEC